MARLMWVEANEAQIEADRQAEEDRRRLVEECRSTRGHEWVLELPEPASDDGNVDLRCLHCPATVDDVYTDGHDMIYLEHDGVTVEAGVHNSPVPLSIPVTVEVIASRLWTDYGWEYDVELVVEVRDCGSDVPEVAA